MRRGVSGATLGTWREREGRPLRHVLARCPSGEAEAAGSWLRDRSRARGRQRTGNTHGHPIGIFPSDLLALGLPLFERVLLFVLELHCAPSARGSRAGDDGDDDPFLDPSRPSPSFLACPFVQARARTLTHSLSRSPRSPSATVAELTQTRSSATLATTIAVRHCGCAFALRHHYPPRENSAFSFASATRQHRRDHRLLAREIARLFEKFDTGINRRQGTIG